MVKVPLNYPIGTPGQPWGPTEKQAWLSSRKIQRSYHDDVVGPLYALAAETTNPAGPSTSNEESSFSRDFEIIQYGELQVENGSKSDSFLPLLAVKPRKLCLNKPCVLVTGGTHGYETSGILGALRFLSSGKAGHYNQYFNVVVVPCVCPWGYERIERWVATAIDPNRSFERSPSPGNDELLRSEESNKLIDFLDELRATTTKQNAENENSAENKNNSLSWLCHMDLHETTNSDFEEFRPAKAARDGVMEYDDHIPDGFYLVGDPTPQKSVQTPTQQDDDTTKLLMSGFYKAILNAVDKVTHIADMEPGGKLSGYPADSEGLILVPCRELGLCAGGAVPGAKYLATTEVFPDSERTNGEECVMAQVEAVCGGMDYLLENELGMVK